MFHADPSVQSTRGKRGKTTHRPSTQTVRGPEGRYIADMKEALAKDHSFEVSTKLGIVATVYLLTCDHPSGRLVTEYDVNAWWFTADELEVAKARALSLPGGRLQRKDTIRYIPAGKRKPRERCAWTEVAKEDS